MPAHGGQPIGGMVYMSVKHFCCAVLVRHALHELLELEDGSDSAGSVPYNIEKDASALVKAPLRVIKRSSVHTRPGNKTAVSSVMVLRRPMHATHAPHLSACCHRARPGKAANAHLTVTTKKCSSGDMPTSWPTTSAQLLLSVRSAAPR